VRISAFIKVDVQLAAYSLKNYPEVRFIRIKNSYLHLNTAEKGFISQIVRVKVRAEND